MMAGQSQTLADQIFFSSHTHLTQFSGQERFTNDTILEL